MCDASDFTIGVFLGQRKEKVVVVVVFFFFNAIYYASKTLTNAQLNYAITEKELLAIVYAFEKFHSYLISTKVIVYTDHFTIKYLMIEESHQYTCGVWRT